jgi:hypothetical protein
MVFAVAAGGATPPNGPQITGGVVSVDPATGVDSIVNNSFAAYTGAGIPGPYQQSWLLTLDKAGNLYGVTEYYYTPEAGVTFPGVVYEIAK